MKKDDVPQDNSRTYGGEKKLLYAVGKDGGYEGVQSSGWEIETYATVSAVEELERQTAAAFDEAKSGKASPLAYHMLARRMDMATLAAATGFGEWRIRRHLKPKIFSGLSSEKLDNYADTLGISVNELKTLPSEISPSTDPTK